MDMLTSKLERVKQSIMGSYTLMAKVEIYITPKTLIFKVIKHLNSLRKMYKKEMVSLSSLANMRTKSCQDFTVLLKCKWILRSMTTRCGRR